MGLSSGRRAGADEGGFRDINVTPLVDVMLVLLIVFMVTTPLLTTGLKVDLPEVKATNTPIKDAKLVLSVSKDGRIFLGESEVTSDVEATLLTNPRVQVEHELYIRADRDARYASVARAMAAARAAGVVGLNLLVDPEDTAP